MLQILFIGLKLANFIAWPWWQVMLPAIISFSILIVFLIFVAIILFFTDK
jgi:hypothetical protein